MFLREPRSHVQSLFYYCTESDWGLNMTENWQREPALSNLPSWLTYYSDGTYYMMNSTFNCFAPLNYQARHLSCSGKGINISLQDHAPQVQEAVDAMNALDVVGIVERYQESICLVAASTGRALPSYCNCEDEEAWATFPELDESISRHNVTTKHGVNELSSHEIEMIDRINVVDTALYKAAVQRFLSDIDAAEQKHRVRILCNRDIVESRL